MTSERGWLIVGIMSMIILIGIRALDFSNPMVSFYASFAQGFSLAGLCGNLIYFIKALKFIQKTALILFCVGLWSASLADGLYRLGYLPEVFSFLCLGLALIGLVILISAILWDWLKLVYLYYSN